MNAFTNDTQSWTEIYDDELIKLYFDESFPVLEISNIMNRSPGSIISRLIKLKLIDTRQSARGYQAYKDSGLLEQDYEKLENDYIELEDRYNDIDEDYDNLEQIIKQLMKYITKND